MQIDVSRRNEHEKITPAPGKLSISFLQNKACKSVWDPTASQWISRFVVGIIGGLAYLAQNARFGLYRS